MYKQWFQNKKAAFFDLDGTIIQSHDHWVEAIMSIFKEKIDYYEIDPEKFIDKGKTNTNKWKLLKSLYSLKKLKIVEAVEETENKFMEIVENKGLEVTEGFWEFAALLKTEKNYKLGLSSNSPRRIVNFVLNYLGMNNVFDHTICGDEVRKPKPNPRMYKKLTNNLKIRKKEIIVFEDSITGSKASVKAGLDTAIIWDMETEKYKYPHKCLGFIANFETFLELMDKNPEDLLLQGIEEATKNI